MRHFLLCCLVLLLPGISFAGDPIAVGQMAPDFELRDATGTPYRLSSFRGKHPVVLEFFRSGGW